MANAHLKNSEVWQKSIDIVDTVYNATIRFPRNNGLGIQMQRASVSLASTIAEASKREDTGDLIEFLGNAGGSLTRLKTQMIIAEHGKFIDRASCAKLHEMCNDVSVMIRNLIQSEPLSKMNEPQYEPS